MYGRIRTSNALGFANIENLSYVVQRFLLRNKRLVISNAFQKGVHYYKIFDSQPKQFKDLWLDFMLDSEYTKLCLKVLLSEEVDYLRKVEYGNYFVVSRYFKRKRSIGFSVEERKALKSFTDGLRRLLMKGKTESPDSPLAL